MNNKTTVKDQKVIVRNYQLAAEMKKHKPEVDAYSTAIKTMFCALIEYVRAAYQFSIQEFSHLVFPDDSTDFYKAKRAVTCSTGRGSGFALEHFLAFSSLFGFSLLAYVAAIDKYKDMPKEYKCPYDAKVTKLFADASARAKREMMLALSKDERLSETIRAYAAELASQPYLEASFDSRQYKSMVWNRQKHVQEFVSHKDEYFELASYFADCFGFPHIVMSELTLGASASISTKYRTYSPAVTSGKSVPRLPTIEEFVNLCLLFGYDLPTPKTQKLLPLDSLILPYLVLTGINPQSLADMVSVALDYETNNNQRRVDYNMLSWLRKNGLAV